MPAEILSKPGRLTETEMLLIRQHAAAGADTVADIDFEGAIADMIRQHHERLDGSGYPAGLRGAEILPEARVLAVADVVEAMISHRPYRPSLTIEEALAEIEGGAGVRYDADGCRSLRAPLQGEGLHAQRVAIARRAAAGSQRTHERTDTRDGGRRMQAARRPDVTPCAQFTLTYFSVLVVATWSASPAKKVWSL